MIESSHANLRGTGRHGALVAFLFLSTWSAATCLSSGGPGYILVKTTVDSYISVANPDCTRNFSLEIAWYNLTLQGFGAAPSVQIWSGSSDPNVHDNNVLTLLGLQWVSGGNVGGYRIRTNSLKDLGTYNYLFQGQSDDGFGNIATMQSDVLPFVIGNSPPTANLAIAGTKKVGNTLTFSAAAHDNDGGTLHYNWSITARPTSSPGNLSDPHAAAPTLVLSDKHDIGNWTVALDLADAQGELKTFHIDFQVINQPPTLNIVGPNTINALENLHLEADPATDADGQTVTWVWDLLQSPPAASRQPMSSFSTDQVIDFVTGPHDIGDWLFRCTAKDEGGLTTQEEVTVTVKAVPPQINIVPSSPASIKVGDTIQFTDTVGNDAYGSPLQFDWEVTQVPIPAGIPLGAGFNATNEITIPTAAAQAGTWKFKLTVTDQVNQTASQEVKVLVDAQPTATIVGPDQTGNLSLPLDLDGTSSTDPDSPNTPPDYNHLHSGPVDVSLPTIAQWQWRILDFPTERYGDVFPGPISDNFNIDDTSGTLHIPSGKLSAGDWTFELDAIDAEGNHATTTKTVQVLDESLKPFAIVLPPEATYTTDVNGLLSQDARIDGSDSFDLDNLLSAPFSPGLGISNYAWSYAVSPQGCATLPNLPSGPSSTMFTLFASGTVVNPACQGTYVVDLEVTDDDTPTAKMARNSSIVRIANCPLAVCIDYPRQTTPQFIKFSNQTDVMIWYHLNSLLYDQPALAAGLRLQLQIFLDTNPATPVYSHTWDVDMLPSNKGAVLATHWYGYDNLHRRPIPGKYNISVQILDASNNPTGFSASEADAIEIQTMDIKISSTTDAWLNYNSLVNGADNLDINYGVSGQQGGGGPGFDELRFRIFNKDTSAKVFEDQFLGPFNGTFTWNGDLGASTFLPPGKYQLELEILDGGASLGISPRYEFRDYSVSLDLAGIADSAKLNPGDFLKEGDTVDLTAKVETDPATLPGDTLLRTDNESGTLTATDGATPVDIDGGITVPLATSTGPKTYQVKGASPGASGKTTISFSYQPPSSGATKKAVTQVGITVVRTRLRAVSSDPTKQDSDGVFLVGNSAPAVVSPVNFGWLQYQMRPVTLSVGPDISSATVKLEYESGNASQLELYLATAPNVQLVLPKTWTASDFVSHKLEVPLLAYGKNFGDVVLKLTYTDGGNSLGQEKIKFRVRPTPDYTGIDTALLFPFFRVLRTANQGVALEVAIDPIAHKERLGAKAAIYIVTHKTLAQWAADATLTDVRGAPTPVTVSVGSIKDNIVSLGAPASPGLYDIVYDFGNFPDDPATFTSDGRLNPGDILDNGGLDQPSVVVEGSFTAIGPQAVAPVGTYDFATAVSVPGGYDGLSGGPFSFRLRGQVVYPTGLAGPAPLVVFVHGNHVPKTVTTAAFGVQTVSSMLTIDENYKGYLYLQTHLASRGYVTLSVDLDEMCCSNNATGYPPIASSGIRLRGWITLKNIEKLLTDGTIAGGALLGKVDPNRIYLVGHSRGGEAVIIAYHLLKVPADRPPGGMLGSLTSAGIKGIVSLSPVTQAISAGSVTLQDVPYLLMYGSADGDVNGAQLQVAPFRHYDRAVSDKYALRIEGANHNNFSTSWGYDDAKERWDFSGATWDFTNITHIPFPSPVPFASPLLGAADQRDLAKAYTTAFLAMINDGDLGAQNYFLESPARLRPLGVNSTWKMHNQARRQRGVTKTVLDDYEGVAIPDTHVSSSGQAVDTGSLGSVWEGLLQDPDPTSEVEIPNRFFEETNGVLFSWAGSDAYTENLAVPDQDLRGAHAISFRIAQQPNLIALAGPISVVVEVEDVAANTSAIDLSSFDVVPGIYQAHIYVKSGMALIEINTTSAAFKTFRIPIESFATDGRSIDLAHISKIRIRVSGSGRAAVDDVEVER